MSDARLSPTTTLGVSEADLRRLIDESAIRDVHLRYTRGCDRMDWDLVRSCYHPGAIDYHGPFIGTVDEFIAWAESVSETIEITQHLVGNQLVEVDGDTAWHEAYTTAFHRFKATDTQPAMHWWLRVRYNDRMERRDGEWRIAERMVLLDGQWSSPVQDLPQSGWLPGLGSTDDPSYERTDYGKYFVDRPADTGPW